MKLLSLSSVAKMCDCETKTVKRWIDAGLFPEPSHIVPKGEGDQTVIDSRQYRWERNVVVAWLTLKFSTGVKCKMPQPNPDKSGQRRTSGKPEAED